MFSRSWTGLLQLPSVSGDHVPGSEANRSPPFALLPLRQPRGQGAQTQDLGACVYLASKEGFHQKGSLGSSWWAMR